MDVWLRFVTNAIKPVTMGFKIAMAICITNLWFEITIKAIWNESVM
jgi:hypothetical protein